MWLFIFYFPLTIAFALAAIHLASFWSQLAWIAPALIVEVAFFVFNSWLSEEEHKKINSRPPNELRGQINRIWHGLAIFLFIVTSLIFIFNEAYPVAILGELASKLASSLSNFVPFFATVVPQLKALGLSARADSIALIHAISIVALIGAAALTYFRVPTFNAVGRASYAFVDTSRAGVFMLAALLGIYFIGKVVLVGEPPEPTCAGRWCLTKTYSIVSVFFYVFCTSGLLIFSMSLRAMAARVICNSMSPRKS